ncbi:phenylalanine--tRNA ligase subunit alpha [Candidatus Falkowbacteria bacterium]|nr:phenylalanine--tRNA ligase subunit alpha [Candidatus Falkowbacteria bacterium]
MRKQLEQLRREAGEALDKIKSLIDLEKAEIKLLGRKDGKLNAMLKSLKNLSEKEKKQFGKLANEIKNEITALIAEKRLDLEKKETLKAVEEDWIDVTLPGIKPKQGSLHPVSIVQYELEDLFRSLGFMILDGPELESDYYNFEALNIPSHHPARDTQDTFYIKGKIQKSKACPERNRGIKSKENQERLLLRTHTSPVQVRAMQEFGAPLRAIAPGRVFRYEASDASHENTFCQLEGLMVEKNISICNLIAVMKTLLKGIFKRDVKIRLRPGYFPFVEPGFELDIECLICGGRGCSVCKQSGWVELLPCGLVHPNVLRAGHIDPEKFSGFAFGLGLTRLVMMRYGINDIRLFNAGDLRFLEQFGAI